MIPVVLLPPHPAALLFPEINEDEYVALRADIQARGVLEPVWIFEDQLLDGRHRARACRDLGIECPHRSYEGDDPVGFVLSLNLHRRMLNESQRGLVAGRLATLKNGQTKRSSINRGSFSASDAAKALHVGRATVERAQRLLRHEDPALASPLIEMVEAGGMGISSAVRELKKREELKNWTNDQLAAHTAATKAQIARAAEEAEQARQHEAPIAAANKPFEDSVRRYAGVTYPLRQALDAWTALPPSVEPMHETVREGIRTLLASLGDLLHEIA